MRVDGSGRDCAFFGSKVLSVGGLVSDMSQIVRADARKTSSLSRSANCLKCSPSLTEYEVSVVCVYASGVRVSGIRKRSRCALQESGCVEGV